MGGSRHGLVSRNDPVVVARERQRHFTVVVGHGVTGDHDSHPALRPLADVVSIALGRQPVPGLEVGGMARVHDAVLEGVPANRDRREEVRKRRRHVPTPEYWAGGNQPVGSPHAGELLPPNLPIGFFPVQPTREHSISHFPRISPPTPLSRHLRERSRMTGMADPKGRAKRGVLLVVAIVVDLILVALF